jgi:ribosomal protein S6
MNKYELAVVVSAKLEEEDRIATIEKVKGYIARFGGTVTEVEEWGKRKLAYEIQKMREGFTTLFVSNLRQHVRQKLKDVFVSWKMSSDIYALDRMHK